MKHALHRALNDAARLSVIERIELACFCLSSLAEEECTRAIGLLDGYRIEQRDPVPPSTTPTLVVIDEPDPFDSRFRRLLARAARRGKTLSPPCEP